jgi:hypothetical protein
MSVLHPKADILTRGIDVGYVPILLKKSVLTTAEADSFSSASTPVPLKRASASPPE